VSTAARVAQACPTPVAHYRATADRRTHTLLVSEVADGITLRHPEDHSVFVVDFKRYDSPQVTFRVLRLGTQETSTGVYVRGPRALPGQVGPGYRLRPPGGNRDSLLSSGPGVGLSREGRKVAC
jgi:hypothetical protein